VRATASFVTVALAHASRPQQHLDMLRSVSRVVALTTRSFAITNANRVVVGRPFATAIETEQDFDKLVGKSKACIVDFHAEYEARSMGRDRWGTDR